MKKSGAWRKGPESAEGFFQALCYGFDVSSARWRCPLRKGISPVCLGDSGKPEQLKVRISADGQDAHRAFPPAAPAPAARVLLTPSTILLCGVGVLYAKFEKLKGLLFWTKLRQNEKYTHTRQADTHSPMHTHTEEKGDQGGGIQVPLNTASNKRQVSTGLGLHLAKVPGKQKEAFLHFAFWAWHLGLRWFYTEAS